MDCKNSLVLVFFIAVSIGSAYSSNGTNVTDFCNTPKCSNVHEHVYCLHPKENYADACTYDSWVVKEDYDYTTYEKADILAAHNRLRSPKCNSTLVWDKDLENLARRWVNQCPQDNENDACRSIDKFNGTVYQNVYKEEEGYQVGAYDYSINYENIVQIWSSWNKNPSFKTEECDKIVNRIGCAVLKRFKAVSLPLFNYETGVAKHVVCNYAHSSV